MQCNVSMNLEFHANKPRLLVAGATGYIGGGVMEAARDAGLWVRALARDPGKLHVPVNDIFVGHATDQRTLRGLCDGVDVVFSSIGIHSFGANPTLWEVDYAANMNILEEAVRAGVKHFMFLSVLRCKELAAVSAIGEARQKVSDAVQSSGLGYTIWEPTGFFNDMEELYSFAKKTNVVALLGAGDALLNPLSALDLGEEIARMLHEEDLPSSVRPVGGPDTILQTDAVDMVADALGIKPRSVRVPLITYPLVEHASRPFNQNLSALFAFFRFVAREKDMRGQPIGRRSMRLFYRNLALGMDRRTADMLSTTRDQAPYRDRAGMQKVA